jgi:hypothetical protein
LVNFTLFSVVEPERMRFSRAHRSVEITRRLPRPRCHFLRSFSSGLPASHQTLRHGKAIDWPSGGPANAIRRLINSSRLRRFRKDAIRFG